MSEVHAAVGSYVVHALGAADRAAFDAHLTQCPTCRLEVTELTETVAELGWLVQSPVPVTVRKTVVSGINQVRPLPPVPPVPTAPLPAATLPTTTAPASRLSRAQGSRRPRVAAFALAAALLVVVGLGGAVVDLEHQRQEQVVATQAQLRLLTAPDAKVYTDKLTSGADVSFVVSKTLDQAMFVAKGLPALDADHAYQLWSMTAHGSVPSTVFASSGDVQVWMKPGIRTGNGVALTVEPVAGSRKPSTQPLVIESL